MTPTEQADPPHYLSAEHHVIGGVRVVTLRGEIDHDVQGVLRGALLNQGGAVPERIVADLSEVTFMDSSGVNIFVTAHQQTTQAAGWIRIAGARPAVRSVLQVTGVDTFVSCHLSVEEALGA
ncbi:STAS domain-containing protein [Streptomyces sp. NPDC046832]|uniref:STAS domain-containing protein n=1 Tax=Streptomyces sp. NPDC046832 TaxID=3155020 RepID=UPI003404C6F5